MKCKECGAIDHVVKVIYGAILLVPVNLDQEDDLIPCGFPKINMDRVSHTQYECGACAKKYESASEVVQLLKG